MNFLKKIDHYLLTNHPILWRTKVHYFILFSLILGNVLARSIGELLKHYHTNTAFIFGLIFLGFSTLFWIISQSRNKIKHYRFWDEVLTFSVYVLCALMLYTNFIVLTQMPIIRNGFGGEFIDSEVLIGGSAFVFISATTTYLIAHTGVSNILGIVLLHFLGAPLVVLIFGDPIAYVILFVFMFIMLCMISENDRITRFVRFFLVPYIPLAIIVLFIYLVQFADKLSSNDIEVWHILLTMTVGTIFGSALIIKRNIKPSA